MLTMLCQITLVNNASLRLSVLCSNAIALVWQLGKTYDYFNEAFNNQQNLSILILL